MLLAFLQLILKLYSINFPFAKVHLSRHAAATLKIHISVVYHPFTTLLYVLLSKVGRLVILNFICTISDVGTYIILLK